MDLKTSLSIALLSFFSATIVVLIARSLDNQAIRSIEPQLTRIADQLEALNSSGPLTAGPIADASTIDPQDGVIVNYFFSNTRCTTCRAIESQTLAVVQSEFAAELQDGTVAWKTLNYEDDEHSHLAEQFEIVMPVVVLTRMQHGEPAEWKRLDQVWGLVNDKEAFATLIQQEIDGLLDAANDAAVAADKSASRPNTAADETTEDETLVDLPLPE
ncbi:nitrophenyl compound nitroreductase subunit ArsF family protein [Stieleria sp. ICT_E10.1]|uniref:nitrophenyl compound nitroreductase subunit ArsF family protein n=1 Tax=Stieleria sedimenti TaxID=2976331 RepID=UPI00217F470D|nr:nitrophenyl compound nitroreductase subunit ArsF family protein [Stieleria sedimenti]MCS7470492.1 nitrophenyl compound nitroreductase subunit ArsF family protein [Stieleria sedimenti]